MHVAVLRNRLARRRHVGAGEVQRVAVGDDAGAADIDEDARLLRRRARNRNRIGNVIRALRPCIDPPRDSVLQHESWPLGGPSRVGVDVNQAGDDELAARVDDIRGVGGDVGLDRGNAASRDGDVANRVEPHGRIDDAPAPDQQVVSCRLTAASLGARASIATPAAAVERN